MPSEARVAGTRKTKYRGAVVVRGAARTNSACGVRAAASLQTTTPTDSAAAAGAAAGATGVAATLPESVGLAAQGRWRGMLVRRLQPLPAQAAMPLAK